MKHKLPTLLSALLLTALPAAAQRNFAAAQKLLSAEDIIERAYVDSVDIDKIVEQGIIGMLKELDPHSTYTSAEETKALLEPLQGNFSGIGVQFQMLQDTVYVIQAVSGGPSEKVGIIPGDRIVAANDTVIAGRKMPNSQVMKHLRGPKGTIVNLKVVRRSEPDTLVFRVKRDDIPLYTVDASYMADPTTGYIRVTSFGQETPKEFRKAMDALRGQGMKNLIIDLQDNGGGYLSAAVDLAGMFLPEGAEVVYTEGRAVPTYHYRAESKGKPFEGKVIVLVNELSASASEILAGAMQDNDRAPIVGRRTFGKGLVQRPFTFNDGSMIRLTTAHYYTPSGRSIQKPYVKGEGEQYRNDIKDRYDHGEFYSADSVKLDKSKVYHTLSGREVYGGGGIMPDVFVPADTTGINKYFREVRAKNVLNQYVVDYVEKNRKELNKLFKTEEQFLEGFEVTPQMLEEFVQLGQTLGVEPDSAQFEECRMFIVGNVKGLIGRDLFTTATYSRVMNPMSPIFKEAMKLVSETNDIKEE